MRIRSSIDETSPFRSYLFRYNYEGASWTFEIQAKSPEDAERRVRRLAFASYQGEVVATLPVSSSFLARLLVVVRNTLKRLFNAKPLTDH